MSATSRRSLIAFDAAVLEEIVYRLFLVSFLGWLSGRMGWRSRVRIWASITAAANVVLHVLGPPLMAGAVRIGLVM